MVNLEEIKGKKIGIVMSSSFFGFFAHAGFVSALEEMGLKPSSCSGSSSGALIAAMYASGIGPRDIHDIIMSLDKKKFWDPDYRNLCKGACKLFKGWSGLLKGTSLRNLMKNYLPVQNFEECSLQCCIIAANITEKNKAVFSTGGLIEAVHASLAVPGLFKAVRIGKNYYVDGGFVVKSPVLDLYKLSSPDVIIVHHLISKELNIQGNAFLKKATTHKISALAATIGHQYEYELECEYVKSLGCKIIEISPETTSVSPNKLENGKIAFKEAKTFTHSFLNQGLNVNLNTNQ